MFVMCCVVLHVVLLCWCVRLMCSCGLCLAYCAMFYGLRLCLAFVVGCFCLICSCFVCDVLCEFVWCVCLCVMYDCVCLMFTAFVGLFDVLCDDVCVVVLFAYFVYNLLCDGVWLGICVFV